MKAQVTGCVSVGSGEGAVSMVNVATRDMTSDAFEDWWDGATRKCGVRRAGLGYVMHQPHLFPSSYHLNERLHLHLHLTTAVILRAAI